MVVNRSAPKAAVVPVLVYEDVDKAIHWLCDTLGFTERLRAGAPGGSASHAQLVAGEGAIMIGRPSSRCTSAISWATSSALRSAAGFDVRAVRPPHRCCAAHSIGAGGRDR